MEADNKSALQTSDEVLIVHLPWAARLFRSLRYRNYRYLWLGQTLQSEGQWMEQVARGWLLWELSRDPFILGLYATLRTLPALLLAIPAGIMTDRINRVAVVQISQISACLMAFAFAYLVQTEIINPSTVWIILAFAVGNGAAEALRIPARQSLVANLVPQRDLMNAIAVNEIAQYTMRIAGPVIAGYMIGPFGVAGVFYLRGVLYLLAVILTALIEAPPTPPQARGRTVAQNLSDTVRYLTVNPVLLAIAFLGAVPAAFGQPYQHLMPIFAKDIFDVGPEGLGILSAAVGIGALVGALVMASLSSMKKMGWLLLASLLMYGVSIVLFGLSPWFAVSLALLLTLGAAQALFWATRQTATQLIVQDMMRGRVTGVGQLIRGGLSPVGSLQAGILATAFGAPAAVAIMGAIVGAVAVGSTVVLPKVRHLEYEGTVSIRADAAELR